MFRLKTLSALLSLLLSTIDNAIMAQSKDSDAGISVSVHVPVGSFSSTHIIGIGAEYSPASHIIHQLKQKRLAFTYNGGLAYYLGKKETVSSYPYKYPGYFFIHAFAGILYNPVKGGSIILTAGPALGIYNGNTQFNLGSKLEASYYISKNIAIGPGIIMMKEPGANPLWAATFKTIINL